MFFFFQMLSLLLLCVVSASVHGQDTEVYSDNGNIVLAPAPNRSVFVNGELLVNGSKAMNHADFLPRLAVLKSKISGLEAQVASCSCNTSTPATANMDECVSSPCANGGACTDIVGGFACACASGFAGVTCETNVHECASSPCQSAGTCIDALDEYTCTCMLGYAGIHCESDINECASSPCSNGGVCTDNVDAFVCACASGFTGVTCETDTAASRFNTTWDTTKTSSGSSTSSQIRLPLESSGTYDVTAWWGDGTQDHITAYDDAAVTHTYGQGGIYTVVIEGTIEGWRFNNGGDKLKLSAVLQWGSLRFGNNGSYFYGAANMEILATDYPDLTGTTNMLRAFGNTGVGLTGNLNAWDTSKVSN